MAATDTGDGRKPLIDAAAFRAMAADCGWSVAEFADFYAAGAHRELAAIAAAAARDDLPELARLAHGARGSSATACVPGMAAVFHGLEVAARGGDRVQAARLLERAAASLEQVLTEIAALA